MFVTKANSLSSILTSVLLCSSTGEDVSPHKGMIADDISVPMKSRCCESASLLAAEDAPSCVHFFPVSITAGTSAYCRLRRWMWCLNTAWLANVIAVESCSFEHKTELKSYYFFRLFVYFLFFCFDSLFLIIMQYQE